MKGYRFYKAAAVAFIIGCVVAACSSGGTGTLPDSSAPSSGQPNRHADDLSLSQGTVTGALIEPLNYAVNGSTVSFSDSTIQCGGSPDHCGLTAANAATWPTMNLITPASLTPGTATLNATCAPPGGSASGGQCYIVALEGGNGPYLISGPGTVSGGTISFAAGTAAIPFVQSVLYNFFLEYVTSIATPAPSTPTPVPSPTFIPTQPPPPTPTPAPATGPACGPFAVLSTNPNYSNVHFAHTSLEFGDVGMNGAGQAGFHLEQQATINGTVHTAPGELVQNMGTVTGGFVSDPPNVAAAVANAENTGVADAALPSTQSMSAINIGNKGSQTIHGSAGLNVLNLSSLEMGHSSTLTLNAPAGSTFVINVAGEMQIGNTAQILLAGGITSNGVTFNFPGRNGQVFVQFTSVVNGTILAPYRTNLHVDHTSTVNGAVVGDGQVMEFAWGDTVGTTCGIAGSPAQGSGGSLQ